LSNLTKNEKEKGGECRIQNKKEIVKINTIYCMDCMEGMQLLEDKSIDCILCDLHYGITDHTWDVIIPYDILWEQYERIIKDDGAIILTASSRFAYDLIVSNPKLYKYKWIWLKNNVTNYQNAKNRPMSAFEEVLIFSKGTTANNSNQKMKYFPQSLIPIDTRKQSFTNYPKDILRFDRDPYSFHPTQKPVALFEYLIKTYTKKGDLVLDNCMGSGTTAIACINTERNFIGFETNEEYYQKSLQRITSNVTQLGLFG
jgi:site-specific DNA-methyltransferase (adenine-specific)